MQTLWLEAVHRRVCDHGDSIWMVQPLGGDEVRSYTWTQGVDEARRIAHHLEALGLPAGSPIAILSGNCAELVLMDVAIWLAGHVSVPLYPTMMAETIGSVLAHCEARAIFVGKMAADAPQLAAIPPELHGIAGTLAPPLRFPRWADIVARVAPIAGEPVRAADDLAVIMYTSGTTGQPKGVELTFGAMAITTDAVQAMFQFGLHDRVVSYLPLAHTGERVVVEGLSLAHGVRVYFNHSLDTFVDDLRRAQPTVFMGVPRIWVKLRERILARIPGPRLTRLLRTPLVGRMVRRKILGQLGLQAVRCTGSGAAPVPTEIIEFFGALGLDFSELYGMTENFAHSHFCRPEQRRRGWIGPAFPGVEVRLGDDGEVQVKTPAVMRGYHRDPEATAAAFTADGFLRTGDRGELSADGYLRLIGRTKEMFKTSKGKYVAPAAIENALVATGLFEQACVMGAGEAQPLAVAVLAEAVRGTAADTAARRRVMGDVEALRVAINQTLPPHEHLSRVVVTTNPWTIEHGLLTPTLKIRRAPVESRFLACASAAPDGASWLE